MRKPPPVKRPLIIGAVIALLGVAIFFSARFMDSIAGAAILLAGVVLVAFRLEFAIIAARISQSAFVAGTTLEDAKDVRPFTITLFGVAMCIVGIAWILDGFVNAHV